MRSSRFAREARTGVRPLSREHLFARGVTPGQLQGAGWRWACHGFYTPHIAGPLTTGQRILDVEPLLSRGFALGGWAAAYVHGVDWLDGRDRSNQQWPAIDVINDHGSRRSTGEVRYRKAALPVTDVKSLHGLPVTSAVRTSFDGARWADGLEDALVFLDAMAAYGLIKAGDVEGHASGRVGATGRAQAVRAAALMAGGVRSPWESRLRYCYQVEAGLQQPLVNVSILDRAGRLLGIADLFDPAAGLVTEYDGEQHREPEHHRRDNIREERLESVNLTVVRADRIDVEQERRSLIRRILDGHRRGQARDRRHDGWVVSPAD